MFPQCHTALPVLGPFTITGTAKIPFSLNPQSDAQKFVLQLPFRQTPLLQLHASSSVSRIATAARWFPRAAWCEFWLPVVAIFSIVFLAWRVVDGKAASSFAANDSAAPVVDKDSTPSVTSIRAVVSTASIKCAVKEITGMFTTATNTRGIRKAGLDGYWRWMLVRLGGWLRRRSPEAGGFKVGQSKSPWSWVPRAHPQLICIRIGLTPSRIAAFHPARGGEPQAAFKVGVDRPVAQGRTTGIESGLDSLGKMSTALGRSGAS